MFKVRTGQLGVPFAELKVDDKRSSTDVDEDGRYDPDAVALAVEQLRQEAKERLQAQPIPKLRPAPVLKPTAYSSRMIYADDFKSSPPSASDLPVAHTTITPRRGTRYLGSPQSSPERELTSSVVKGRVAEGLLGLRNAV